MGTFKKRLLEHKKGFLKPKSMISESKISIDNIEKGMVTTNIFQGS